VCRLHEIPLKPRLRGSVQRFARLTVLVNGKCAARDGPNLDHRCIRMQKISCFRHHPSSLDGKTFW
jgi:hypothetical protein